MVWSGGRHCLSLLDSVHGDLGETVVTGVSGTELLAATD
jgi:hypothetical protein